MSSQRERGACVRRLALARVLYALRMRIPKFDVEKRQQVQARIPVSQVTQLKALAVANAVPVSRVLHYAVECLLEAARAADPAVLRSGIVERDDGASSGDALTQVADALGFDASEREAQVDARAVVAPVIAAEQSVVLRSEASPAE